jgi:hypothetical protein
VANNVNVTNRGFEYLCNYIAGNYAGSNWTAPTWVGWGGANGSNATSVVSPGTAPSTVQGTGQWSDVAPYQEFSEARVQGSYTVIQNTAGSGTVGCSISSTITASAGENVGESFLAFSSAKPYSTTLFTAITAAATSMTVSTAWPSVSVPFYLQNNNEVIEVSATASTTTATIARAQNGSTACSASSGNTLTLGNIPGAGASNPHSGDMFAHAGFVALALNANDSISFSWTIDITS